MLLLGNCASEKIWFFLKSKGLSDFACSGIIGNMDAESGLNPSNVQDLYEGVLGFGDTEYVLRIDSGQYTKTKFTNDAIGFGICQWTWHTRKAALYDYAKSKGTSIGDLETQLEFFYKELSESFPGVLSALKSVKSVREASDLILLKYERPADMSESVQIKRASIGQKYYSRFAEKQSKEVIMGYITFAKSASMQLSKHFHSTEFDCHGSGCCTETKVNEKLIEILEQIREHFDAPITITSAYRCPTHNSRIGGATGSRHTKADAADIVVKGVAPRKVAQYAESIGVMGIGLYETSKDGYFVHVDTREKKSFWYGQSEQTRSTFGASSNGTTTDPNTQNTGNLDTILNMGDRGSAVKTMQEKLIRLRYSCGDYGADGDFGSDTYNAVCKFQREHNIGVDGIAGSQTLTAIDEAIKKLIDDGGTGKTVKITASALNVRSGPGKNYPAITYVRKGAVCTVVEERDGWGRIDSPAGWISGQYYKDV